jgi:myo-inositol-1(or 4)-monophosphatase
MDGAMERLVESADSMDSLLELAVAAAHAGGAVLVEGLSRSLEVQQKSERSSIVTWADLTAQAAIVELLTQRAPDHAIVGEEGNAGADRATAPVTWIVDPLDGTSNYAAGIRYACVSIAALDADGLVAAAVLDPFTSEVFTASRGGGAWCDGRQLRVKDTKELTKALVCTGVQSDDEPTLVAFGKRITDLYLHTRGVRMLGSPALTLCHLAAGRVDAFIEEGATYAWDTAAGALIIREAGGTVTGWDGGELNLSDGFSDVVATCGPIHDALLDLIHHRLA